MTNYAEGARKVIGDFVRPECTLTSMNKIHKRITGESENYTQWQDAQEFFMQRDWDEESYEEFLRVCKETVEADIDKISESYLDVHYPQDLDADSIKGLLDGNQVTGEPGHREGFDSRVRDSGVVFATYYYHSTEVDITPGLELDEVPYERNVTMVFEPENRLVTIKDTRPAAVQKAKSVINEDTEMKVEITGNLNSVPDDAEQIVKGFIDTFESERPEGDENE